MERRPIASRNTRWADACASAIAKTGITPNAISVCGMIFAILGGACFYFTQCGCFPPRLLWIAGAVFVQLRLLANLFDGMVAQLQKATSPLGELYNEIPDRISDAVILVGFGYAIGSSASLGFVAACLALFVAYVRAQIAVSGGKQLFIGPMAKAHRMAVIIGAAIATAILPEVAWPVYALWIVIVGSVLTAIRRILRGGSRLSQGPSKPPFDY